MKRYAMVGGIFTSIFLFLSIWAPCLAQSTAILGAFEAELTWLEGKLEQRREQDVMGLKFITGKVAGRSVVLALIGVGKVNAAMTTTLLIEHFQPDAVIFSGVAGGLNPDLLPGDIVIGARAAQHDLADIEPDSVVYFGVKNPVTGQRNPIFIPADSALLALAEASVKKVELERIATSVGERVPHVITGVIATGDAFITSTPKKQEIHRNLGADAVEMEGAAVMQVCYQLGVPCLLIRALSDNADEYAMEDFEKFYRVAARNANRVVLGMLDQN